jgi:hypothetical protein
LGTILGGAHTYPGSDYLTVEMTFATPRYTMGNGAGRENPENTLAKQPSDR